MKIRGTGITNLKISGRIRVISSNEPKLSEAITKGAAEERLRLENAIFLTKKQISLLKRRAGAALGKEEASIFDIHIMLLEDEDFIGTVNDGIENGKSAEEAVKSAEDGYCRMLTELGDEYLSERANDIRDISRQLIRVLLGLEEETEDEDAYILVSRDLTPSETVRLDKSKILGFITEQGTSSSHTAILARAMGIPALVGTGALPEGIDGKFAILNAEKSYVIIEPTRDESAKFEKEKSEQNKIATEHERYLRSVMHKPAVTRSGHKIMIYANIGDIGEVDSALANGAEGIGLLRSELLYLSEGAFPSEERLFSSYKEIAMAMQGRRVIIRTLDIGADKQLPYFPLKKEENPALGLRGVRLCLSHREIFKTQLRAILRASSYGSISLMIPMVSEIHEIRETKILLEECKKELENEGIGFDSKIELGIMIETPAAAIMSDILATEVDFFSVGTNDLTQYTLAADRQNSSVADICDRGTEAVMRLIKTAADAIHKKGGWIGVCGEMAADLSQTEQLARLRVDELSVSVPYLLGIRGKVSECR